MIAAKCYLQWAPTFFLLIENILNPSDSYLIHSISVLQSWTSGPEYFNRASRALF